MTVVVNRSLHAIVLLAHYMNGPIVNWHVVMPLIYVPVLAYLFKFSNECSLFLLSENGTEGGGSRVKYSVMDVPITLPSTKPATDKPNPKQGIGELLLCFAT
jgi:hypothetical protein